MTTENRPDDRDLERYLAGEHPLSDAYRQSTADEQPSAALDAAILAEAAEAADAITPRQPTWFRPLAAAAVLVLCIGLGVQVSLETDYPEPDYSGTAEQSPDHQSFAPEPAADMSVQEAPAANRQRAAGSQPMATTPPPPAASSTPAARAEESPKHSLMLQDRAVPADAPAAYGAGDMQEAQRSKASEAAPALQPEEREARSAGQQDGFTSEQQQMLAEIRRHIAADERAQAQALIRRWQERYPNITLPDDIGDWEARAAPPP